jgi:hypothetical protein
MDFAQVEEKVAKLRRDLAAGRLTEEQFKTQLREMMVEDVDGNWWMVGYETGEWYRHDGSDWVRADPPGQSPAKPVPPLSTQAVAPTKPRSHPVRGIIVFILGLVISGVVGWGIAALIFSILSGSMDHESANAIAFAAWGAVGLGGLILTFRAARNSWRGK